jgi:hypothetical protein
MKRIGILAAVAAALALVIGVGSAPRAMACLTASCQCPSYHHC